MKLLFGMLLLSVDANAALTPINPNGNGDGAERCLTGATCPAGGYAGVVSILRAFEIDQGLAPGSLQRVDDSLDKRWVTLGPQAALRPLARYANDSSLLGVGVSSGAGVITLTTSLSDTHVWVDHPGRFSGAKSSDFARNTFPWYGIPGSSAPFAFILDNLSSSLYLSSDPSMPGFANSGYTQDWMVTWRVPGQNLYVVAWEDRVSIGANGLPNDYDYNDYVFVVRDAEPLAVVPLPAAAGSLMLGVALLGAGVRRRRAGPAR
jgi:hypothetical protein